MFCQILILFFLEVIRGCKIAGKEIGQCVKNTVFQKTSFCGGSVEQNVCIPLPSTAWKQSSTVQYRDRQIEDIFMFYVQNRLLSQYIYVNTTQILSNNKQCYNSYKKFLCQFNFPKCSFQDKISFPVCKSVCVQFFEDCMSSSDACDIIYNKKDPGLDSTC